MAYKIEINYEAELDTLNAVDYYGDISSSLVDRFISELKFVYQKIAVNPKHYKYVRGGGKSNFRCTRLRSFPYLVIFCINRESIVIVAVLNTYRKNKFL